MKNRLYWRYLKKYRTRSISIRNFSIFSLLILMLLVISGILFYSYAQNMVYSQVKATSYHDVAKTKEVVDNILVKAERLTANLCIKNNVRLYMLGDVSADDSTDILKTIKSYTLIYDYIDSIYIYAEERQMVFADTGSVNVSDFADGEWLSRCREEITDPHMSTTIYRRKNGDYPYLISIVKPVSNDYKVVSGYVIININSRKLLETLPKTNDGEQRYIVSENGLILYSDNVQEIFRPIDKINLLSAKNVMKKSNESIFENSHISSVIQSDLFKLKYIRFVSESEYAEIFNSLSSFITGMVILMIFLSLTGAALLAIRAYKPIKNIIEVIQTPENWVKKRNDQSNEIDEILDQIISLVNLNKDFKDELSDRLTLLNQTYNIALQTQINPHFICNTLEAINWKIVDYLDIDNTVSPMVNSLAKMLRYTLETDDTVVPLQDEIKYTQIYLDIINERYEKMVDIVWDIEPGLENAGVIRLSIQPIVENAIYHGIKPKMKCGQLRIRIRRREKIMKIQIEDNGVGLSEDQIQEISSHMNKQQVLSGKHIGIANVNQRIKLAFGDEYGLILNTSQTGGLTVEMNFPYQSIANINNEHLSIT